MADGAPSQTHSKFLETSETDEVRLEHAKVHQVLQACDRNDIDALQRLAASTGGLVSDLARQAAWPILLGSRPADDLDTAAWQDLPSHKDEDQVALDVNRAFVYYPSDDTEKRTDLRKLQLSDVIVAVLRRNPFLNYFQGYHDIAQVFLLVLGAAAAVPAVERLSLLRIRDFMLPTMTASISHLSLLPAILAAADSELHRHLVQTAPFYFALPATLTLYAHDIQEYGDIARLFDYLLAKESVISIYLFAIIICSRKQQLLELEASEHDMLHATLSKLPKPLNLDLLIQKTDSLFADYPPEMLRGLAWYSISQNSVLKTARRPDQIRQQTLKQGALFFRQQALEIERQDARRVRLQLLRRLVSRYRRPAILISSSVLVAVVSLYLIKEPAALDSRRLMEMLRYRTNSLFEQYMR